MRKLKNIIAIAAIALTAAFAQAQDKGSRVCHVGSQEIVEAMPEAKQAEKTLRNLEKTYFTRLDEMDKELKTKYSNAQQAAANRSKEENDRVLKELSEGQKKLEEYYQQSQQAVSQKRVDILKPLLEKVRKAIQKVARAKGYQYVLDSTNGTGLILADGYDITPDVKAELGIQ